MILTVTKLFIRSRMSKGLILSQAIFIFNGLLYRVLLLLSSKPQTPAATIESAESLYFLGIAGLYVILAGFFAWLSLRHNVLESDVQYLFLMPLNERTLFFGVLLGSLGFTLLNYGLVIGILAIMFSIPPLGIPVVLLLLLNSFFSRFASLKKRKVSISALFSLSLFILYIYSLFEPNSLFSLSEALYNEKVSFFYLLVLTIMLVVFIRMSYRNVLLLFTTFYEPKYKKAKEKKVKGEEEFVFADLKPEKAVLLKSFHYAHVAVFNDIVVKGSNRKYILISGIISLVLLVLYFVLGITVSGIIMLFAMLFMVGPYVNKSVFAYEPVWLSFGIMNPAKFARLYITGRVLSLTLGLLPFTILFPFLGWQVSVLVLQFEILTVISAIVIPSIGAMLSPISVMGYRVIGYQKNMKTLLNSIIVELLGFVAMGLPFLGIFIYLLNLLKPPFFIIFSKLPFLDTLVYLGYHPQIIFMIEAVSNTMLIIVFGIVSLAILFSESFWNKVVENMTKAGIS